MKETTSRYLIIGAGLSGLSTAYQLKSAGETDFKIIESRDRTGGRVNTEGGIDFGATWFNDGHSTLLNFLNRLKIEKYPQFSKGESYFAYSSIAPPQVFETNPDEPVIYRVKGGTSALIHRLTQELSEEIQLNEVVQKIEEHGDQIKLTTSYGSYVTNQVIITLPPKLASCLEFKPSLPESLLKTMRETHTWMSNAIKVGIRFKSPFWREKGQSGTLVGQAGAVIELYDHCNYEGNEFALMGFVNENLRELERAEQEKSILEYLKKHFGREIEDYISFELKDWSKDEHTTSLNLKSMYGSSHYGNILFQQPYLNGKVVFSGAETSRVHGGYLEGAVYSGLSVAQKILNPTN